MIEGLYVCDERRGTRLRRVKEVEPSQPVEEWLRKMMPKDALPMKDPGMIFNPKVRTLLVDSVGAIVQGPLDYEGMPDVHVVFWDLVLVGREAMCRSIAKRFIEDAGSYGVFTAIPRTSRATLAFAKRVGFKSVHESDHIELLTLTVR